jgi:hypothetical protein
MTPLMNDHISPTGVKITTPTTYPRPSDDGNWLDASVWGMLERIRLERDLAAARAEIVQLRLHLQHIADGNVQSRHVRLYAHATLNDNEIGPDGKATP